MTEGKRDSEQVGMTRRRTILAIPDEAGTGSARMTLLKNVKN